MRHWIQLVEAAAPYAGSFWFNPETKNVVRVGDHGEAVESDPYLFDVSDADQFAMANAFPYSEEDGADVDHDALPEELKWRSWTVDERNDAWEELGMNRGWVRGCGSIYYSGSAIAAYLSASTPEGIWHGAKYLLSQDGALSKVEVEIVNRNGGLFVTLIDDLIDDFVKAGQRRAGAFLTRLKAA